MRRIIAALALASFSALGFVAPSYTNTYESDGVTMSQLGGVKASNYVVIALNTEAIGTRWSLPADKRGSAYFVTNNVHFTGLGFQVGNARSISLAMESNRNMQVTSRLNLNSAYVPAALMFDRRISMSVTNVFGLPAIDVTGAYAQEPGDIPLLYVYGAPLATFRDATNASLSALGPFSATGSVHRADVFGTPNRWTDATGCVWEVGQDIGKWTRTQGPSDIYVKWHDGDDDPPYTSDGSGWYFQGDHQWPQIVSKDASATILSDTLQNDGYYGQGIVATFVRGFVDITNLVGRVALTGDMPYLATNANGEVVLDRQLSFVSAGENGRTVVQVGGDSESDSPTLLVGVENPLEYGGVISVRGLGERNITIGGGSEISPNNAICYNGTNIIPLVFGAAQRTEISATDPTFSNAVLSVGLGIDTNAVAAINALVEQGEELPMGGATTVGALLLALAAAIAALKRKKADNVSGATAGDLAALDAQGNLTDSGVKPSDFAAKADLPYALVTPGEWTCLPSTFEGEPITVRRIDSEGVYYLQPFKGDSPLTGEGLIGDIGQPEIKWNDSQVGFELRATRASLPGHLLDRAGNHVVVSGDTTLTLPAAVPGYIRDFLVRLEISGSTVPTITFAAPTGETIVYETDGDEFPVPDAEGTWLYSFTETAAHTFAVALKSVSVVTQGGS